MAGPVAFHLHASPQELEVKLRERESTLMAAEDAASRLREEEEALATRVYEERPFVAQPYSSGTAAETAMEIEECDTRPSRPYLVRIADWARGAVGCKGSPALRFLRASFA